MYGTLDISTSGMTAQRVRLAAIASNIANRHTILDSQGRVNPYRAKYAMFAAGNPGAATAQGRQMGVHVKSIELDSAPPSMRWDPSSPYAYKTGVNAGYVPEPNVDLAVEQINALDASRAYEANVAAAEVTKSMAAQAIRLLA